jgi:hypothetical protein
MAAEQDDDDFEFEPMHAPSDSQLLPASARAHTHDLAAHNWHSFCQGMMTIAKAVTVSGCPCCAPPVCTRACSQRMWLLKTPVLVFMHEATGPWLHVSCVSSTGAESSHALALHRNVPVHPREQLQTSHLGTCVQHARLAPVWVRHGVTPLLLRFLKRLLEHPEAEALAPLAIHLVYLLKEVTCAHPHRICFWTCESRRLWLHLHECDPFQDVYANV